MRPVPNTLSYRQLVAEGCRLHHGISTQYREAVRWFSASFAILALDTMLVALLAAQRWRQTGKLRYMAVSVLFAGLAPCWFAGGLMAGPMCTLYLLVPESTGEKTPGILSVSRQDKSRNRYPFRGYPESVRAPR